MIKRSVLKIVCMLTLAIILTSTQVFARITNVSNNFKTYVQPTDNVVKGESMNYTFFMPESWRNKVNVYRQSGEVGDNYLEKISFYYSPNGTGNVVNKNNESLFLTITVYATGQNARSSSENEIFVQNGYTFTALVTSQNNYKDTTVRSQFDQLVTNSSSVDYLKKYINFNNIQSQSTSSIVYYKNANKNSTSYIDDNGVVYVPLRDFADAMGFNITWYDAIKGCKVTKNGVSDIVYQKSDNSVYQTKSINNRLYVTINYLRDKWDMTIYIDNKSNVFISE